VAPSVQRSKVSLTPTTRVSCSNAAKTRNPLKSAVVPQTDKIPYLEEKLNYLQMTLIYLCLLKQRMSLNLKTKANSYLRNLDNWLKANKLHLNIDKTSAKSFIRLTRKLCINYSNTTKSIRLVIPYFLQIKFLCLQYNYYDQ